jgi:hypothetical protein
MSAAEVLPDGVEDGVPVWAVVCDREFPGHLYCGHVRRADEPHAGKFVYPFERRESAEAALAEMEAQL